MDPETKKSLKQSLITQLKIMRQTCIVARQAAAGPQGEHNPHLPFDQQALNKLNKIQKYLELLISR